MLDVFAAPCLSRDVGPMVSHLYEDKSYPQHSRASAPRSSACPQLFQATARRVKKSISVRQFVEQCECSDDFPTAPVTNARIN